jgi:hypothetical protein
LNIYTQFLQDEAMKRVTAPRVLHAETVNDECSDLYCDPRTCHGIKYTCNSGEQIPCLCVCHTKAAK